MFKNLFLLLIINLANSDVIHYHFHNLTEEQQRELMEADHKLFGFNFSALFSSCKRDCIKQYCTESKLFLRCVEEEQDAYEKCVACKCEDNCPPPVNVPHVNPQVAVNAKANATVKHLDENPVF